MKNLDIEKLERKNIYQVPDNFFEQMQAKVLQETAPVKERKFFKMNWAYSAAAAVALLFGITFLVNNEGSTENTEMAVASANLDSIKSSILADKPKIVDHISYTDKRVKEDKIQEVKSVEINAQRPKAIATVTRKMTTAKIENTKINTQQENMPMDQILSSFTSADLADLGRNTEQDIYLDLYN
ncbi:hypothetical protein [Chryseobacterium sp. MP_3.2]|uniref:hypothetical protein n=1 Tax=Chryseobacterium sp. MP_3.2 TaxID=3071712 RepID=UPI002E0A81E8|nr:hypothetical protein [Chryseobacterium sp. MP_3.2]